MSLTALFFLVAFGAGCTLAIIRHPIYGLLTYIFVFYLNPSARWWGEGVVANVRWSFVAAIVALVAAALHKPTGPTVPILRNAAFWGMAALTMWVGLGSLWASDQESNGELLEIYVKFTLVLVLMFRSIDSEKNVRLFLWAHALGCAYLGWVAFDDYRGGRFEGFGERSIGDANAAALELVTGLVTGATLFIAAPLREKLGAAGTLPFILNAIVTTISRSGFIATAVAGIVFNAFTPRKYRTRVLGMSIVGLLLFSALTTPDYWARMATIEYAGEAVEGVDTGWGRRYIIGKQWEMFKDHPLGCGHMCTTFLSPDYMEAERLSQGGRASHNTFMSMLVDQGVPGAIFYLVMTVWTFTTLIRLARELRGSSGLMPAMLPGVAASLGAITIGDMFVQYPRYETRLWFIAVMVIMLHLAKQNRRSRSDTESPPQA